ncbi:MAG: hypothetical protein M3Y59_11115 [Myxococcota bacterium]|nr:hypothetical protein [Myxococcota bacterium]
MKQLLIAALAIGSFLLLPACGDDNNNPPDGGPGQPDAGPGQPDGGPGQPDGGPGQPDGGPDPVETFPQFVIRLVTQPEEEANLAAPLALPTEAEAADDNSEGVFDSLF